MRVRGLHATEGSVDHENVTSIEWGRGMEMHLRLGDGEDAEEVTYPNNWVECSISAE